MASRPKARHQTANFCSAPLAEFSAAVDIPWKSMSQLEWETLKWVDWYNTKRLHSAIGYVTPHEAEEIFYAALNPNEKAA